VAADQERIHQQRSQDVRLLHPAKGILTIVMRLAGKQRFTHRRWFARAVSRRRRD